MLRYFKKIGLFCRKSVFWLSLCAFFGFNTYLFADETSNLAPLKYQYAVFYMETEGDFVVPVGVDDPAIYSWSEPGKSIKGEINQIWDFLEIESNVEYSFTEIESVLLNHVASRGWEFQELAITSVPIPYSNRNFRTAYRYIFKRAITSKK